MADSQLVGFFLHNSVPVVYHRQLDEELSIACFVPCAVLAWRF